MSCTGRSQSADQCGTIVAGKCLRSFLLLSEVRPAPRRAFFCAPRWRSDIMSRPTIFSEELADAICERLALGEPLIRLCAAEDMPGERTVYRWVESNESFRQKYVRAREAQAERMAEEILDIADNATNDWMARFGDDDGGWQANGEHMQRSRLRVDSRKWLMSKMLPKKYGDKLTQEVTGADGGPQRVVYEWASPSAS